MNYRNESSLSTGINTRINETVRISSIWRTYSNDNFSSQAWETFLWEGDKIAKEYDTLRSADSVVDLHLEILNNYKKGNTP
jgi:hypothetical protein